MNEIKPTVQIVTYTTVNDFPFGADPIDLYDLRGPPDSSQDNYTGELELLYGDTFYRFYAGRFVECTFPDAYRFIIDSIEVLSVFDWLQGRPDIIDKARFRISLQLGLAYDFRNRQQGSITIFEQGRWDELVLNY